MYTIKEASTRSGVSVPLLRAWERRYGVVEPIRTAAGYRLYDEAAIDRLRAMRGLIEGGWSAQQAAQRVREATADQLSELVRPGRERSAPPEPTTVAGDDTVRDLVRRFVDASRELDAAELEAALDEAFTTGRFEQVAERVLMPALRAVGDAWERKEVSVAGEHAASQAVLRRLAMAYDAAADVPSQRPVLIGLGPGARHEFGALAFATAARRAGLPVLYLGPDLPADSWTIAAVGREARGVVIGVPTRADLPRARAVLEALREARPGMPLAVGGREAHRLASEMGVTLLPAALPESVEALRSTLDAATARR